MALRSPQFDDRGWAKDGPGRFVSQRTELKLDLQTGEVLWRNDNLKPVPDSIAQFSDYQAFFQGRSLHCGVVAKQQHRQWIHVVGTEYDLIEWDEPNTSDQGVGCPKAPERAPEAEEDISPELAEAAAQLMSFGFDYQQCLKGLKLHNNNVEATANWLFSGAPEMAAEASQVGSLFGLGQQQRPRQPQVRPCSQLSSKSCLDHACSRVHRALTLQTLAALRAFYTIVLLILMTRHPTVG
jgi:hypothetical protein